MTPEERLDAAEQRAKAAESERDRLQAKLRGHVRPGHGPCCTCQRCGRHYDDCRCDLDDTVDALEKVEAERDSIARANVRMQERFDEEAGRLHQKMDAIHDALDAAGATYADGTHGQAVDRVRMLGREIKRLRERIAGGAPYSVQQARRLGVCRLCGTAAFTPPDCMILEHEHAHRSCLNKEAVEQAHENAKTLEAMED